MNYLVWTCKCEFTVKEILVSYVLLLPAQHISRVHSCSSLRQHPSPTRLSTPTTRFPALCGSFIPWWHLVAEWCCSEHLFLSEVCTVWSGVARACGNSGLVTFSVRQLRTDLTWGSLSPDSVLSTELCYSCDDSLNTMAVLRPLASFPQTWYHHSNPCFGGLLSFCRLCYVTVWLPWIQEEEHGDWTGSVLFSFVHLHLTSFKRKSGAWAWIAEVHSARGHWVHCKRPEDVPFISRYPLYWLSGLVYDKTSWKKWSTSFLKYKLNTPVSKCSRNERTICRFFIASLENGY
jgi:hypothetical protein